MSRATCVVSPDALRGAVVELTGDLFHHLFRVRRLEVGDPLRLVDGRGMARWGRIEEVTARRAVVRLGEPAASGEADLRLELWVAAPRPQRAAWLVEKATEVGVSAVRWIETERGGREVTPSRLERMQRVAAAAVEQAHRSRLPQISGPIAWSEVIDRLAATDSAWFLDLAEGEPSPNPGAVEEAVLLVGPEGGWTGTERADLVAVSARPVSLGPRVLRVETAAVVGAALALCR